MAIEASVSTTPKESAQANVISVRRGAHLNQKDAAVLLPILHEMGNEISEEKLVELSTPEDSPTHHLFIWDDAKAAHLQRVAHARTLIAAFEIQIDQASEPVRAFPSVVVGGHRQYVPMSRALSSEEFSAFLVKDAISHLRTWQRRN